MPDQDTWRQYLVVDLPQLIPPLRELLGFDRSHIDVVAVRKTLAETFRYPADRFEVVTPPLWRLPPESEEDPPSRTVVSLPLRFHTVDWVNLFRDQFAWYESQHPTDLGFVSINSDMAIQLADYCGPFDISGAMLGRRVDARRLIRMDALAAKLTAAELAGINGNNVNIVLIDEGIDKNSISPPAAYATGWTPSGVSVPLPAPGATPPQDARHSTMMLRNITDVAPNVRIFDVPLIRQPKYGDLLAFIAAAHDTLLAVFNAIKNWQQNHPTKYPGPWILVNGWAPFDLRREIPLGGYSNNALNEFHILINDMVSSGIDVVFCAGNCGAFCPDGRCGPNDTGPGRSILGAASHPLVISVGAVRVDKMWIGYSSQGPGQPNLSSDKPDICAPSGFAENHDNAATNIGTSAASGVVAGVVAALRTKWPPSKGSNPVTPKAVLNGTAQKRSWHAAKQTDRLWHP